jgi:uncharacterized membrane protein (UPF0127 family)
MTDRENTKTPMRRKPGEAASIVAVNRGSVVCERSLVAETAWARLKGLLGRAQLARGEGLLLRPSASIHTWFMRFPIDVVFLDGDLRVIATVTGLRPWRVARQRGARAALELASGECERRGVAAGDALALVDPRRAEG